MSYRLYIAEKHKLANKIISFLGASKKKNGYSVGDGWIVTHARGHLYQLLMPEEYDEKYANWSNISNLPIIPETWRVKPSPDKVGMIKTIQKLIDGCDSIVHVGDPDKEGQYLVDVIIRMAGYNGPVYRWWPTDISETGIATSFSQIKPNSEFRGISLAAEYRGRADWLIGINFTRLFTHAARSSGYRDLISLGRVQSPTLSLVVNRCREIKSFKSVKHFSVNAELVSNDIPYDAVWVIPENLKNPEGYMTDIHSAQKVVSSITGKTGIVTTVNLEIKETSPHPLFNQTDLQVHCDKKKRFPIKQTLKISQELYDQGFLTYPRTADREVLVGDLPKFYRSIEKFKKINVFSALAKECIPDFIPKCAKKTKTAPHDGLTPTDSVPDLDKLSEDERFLYIAVVERFLCQFLPKHKLERTEIITDVAGHVFKTISNKVLRLGWKMVGTDEGDEDEHALHPTIEGLKQSLPAVCKKQEIANKSTSAPGYFTEATLAKAMENIHKYVTDPAVKKMLRETDGIGTEATKVTIVERIIKVKYVNKNKKGHLIATKVGNAVYDAFPEPFKEPSMTAFWEAVFKKMEEGLADHNLFYKEQLSWLSSQIEVYKKNLPVMDITVESKYKCPKCARDLRRIKSRSGYFWSCAGYPDDCKQSYSEVKGKPLFPIDGDGVLCDKCKDGKMRTRSSKKNDKGRVTIFLGCSNFPKCRNAVFPEKK